MQKPAETAFPLEPALRDRWSPRAFADRALDRTTLGSLLEAFRWAPSASNAQPWRLVVGRRGHGTTHDRLAGALTGRNTLWAPLAPVLILTLAQSAKPEQPPGPAVWHDLGLALGLMLAQAAALGVATHVMAGIDRAALAEAFARGPHEQPVVVVAAGWRGDPASLADPGLRERELAPRTRRPLADIVSGDGWTDPV